MEPEEAGALFLDLITRITEVHNRLGPGQVKAFFPKDHTRTGTEGAAFTAGLLLVPLREIKVPGMPPTPAPN